MQVPIRTGYVAVCCFPQLVALGDRGAAMAELEEAIEERVRRMMPIQFDPSVAALGRLPHFESLVARVRGKETR